MITTAELSERWNVPQSTLRAWRKRGQGPRWKRLNHTNLVVYTLKEVERYEKKWLHMPGRK